MDIKFDIILQNNASREVFLLEKQKNRTESINYLLFENVELPSNMPDGEYNYAIIGNMRTDVVYDFQNDLLESLVKTQDGNILLKNLRPFTGLLKIKGDNGKMMFYEQREEGPTYSQNMTIYYYK